MSNEKFYRLSATGNTFILSDQIEKSNGVSPEERKRFVKDICGHAIVGFKTDGFIFLDPDPTFDFTWDFYNSDGSPTEMCGNAARAAAYYFWHFRKKQKNIAFNTKAGRIEVSVISDAIFEVKMPIVHGEPIAQKLANGIEGFFVNTGVPHFVIDQGLTRDKASEIRFAKDFGLAGTNVTSITQVKKENTPITAKAVTFERGVDDFTLSCGTGAVAAALVAGIKICHTNDVVIEMPGGNLEVRFESLQGKREIQAFLKGPAKLDFIISSLGL